MTEVRLNPDGLTSTLTQIFQAAGGTQEEASVIAKNLVAALSGEVPPNLVNPEYRDNLRE